MFHNRATDQLLNRAPSLNGLKFFLTAAKYKNFTKAADTLCVTQSAVSRQIRELEEYLECKLFHRNGRKVELTEPGKVLYDTASVSISNIANTMSRIKATSKGSQSNTLSICATTAFSTLWMSEKISEFRNSNPDLDICIITTDNFQAINNLSDIDIFISPGKISRSGFISEELFKEKVYPVCSPKYLESHPQLKAPDDLLQSSLLHLTTILRSYSFELFDWELWFEHKGILLNDFGKARAHDLTANNYQLLIQMAMEGQGIALGWHHLVKDLVDKGKLAPAIKDGEVSFKDRLHYISYFEDLEKAPKVKSFIDWMKSQIQ
jgi:LysR family glycine cleavage system transcriptional activator